MAQPSPSSPVDHGRTLRRLSLLVQLTSVPVNLGILIVLALLLRELRLVTDEDFHLHVIVDSMPTDMRVYAGGLYGEPIGVKVYRD